MGESEEIENLVDAGMKQTENYIEILTELKKMLAKADPKDRLEFALNLIHCIKGMSLSIKGWSSWLTNIETLNTLSLDDLKDVYPKIKKVAFEFIEIDLEITKRKLMETKEKQGKKDKKHSKGNYIS